MPVAEPRGTDSESSTSRLSSPRVVSLETFRNHLAAQKGTVIVVDLWALWCGHCVAELPHFAKLNQRYRNDVHAISLNVDFDADQGSPQAKLLKRIGKTLIENKVKAENLVCSTPFEKVLTALDLFSLPACLIYSPDGELYKKFEGDVRYERDVFPLIDSLLQEQPLRSTVQLP